MIILCPVDIIRAHQLTRAKNDIRYYFNGFNLSSGRIESTNGHQALVTESPYINGPEKPVIVNMSKVPASSKLQTAVIDTEAGIVYWMAKEIITLLDIDGSHIKERLFVGTVDIINGNFPDVKRIFTELNPKRKGINFIGYKTEYLENINKISKALKMTFGIVKMNFNDNTNPTQVEFKQGESVTTYALMPAKL